MARASSVRALPWARILVIARIVMARFGEDLSDADRRRLSAVLKATRGNPTRLTSAQRQDLVRILRQVDLGKLSREIAAVGATGRLLRR